MTTSNGSLDPRKEMFREGQGERFWKEAEVLRDAGRAGQHPL